MKILNILILMFALLSPSAPFQTKGWRGIVPLRSTRADVEALLGKATYPDKSSYELDEMNIFFSYTTVGCEEGEARRWNVAPGTVRSFLIYPRPQPELSDLNLDESRYEKEEIREGEIHYRNKRDGISIEVYRGAISSFHYGPSEGDNHLKCPGYDDTVFPSDMPKQLRARLIERLNQFVEYSMKRQYENKFDLYLPDYAAKHLGTTNKHEFVMQNNAGGFNDNLVGFKPITIRETEAETYGKAYEVYGLAKTSENGKVVESYRTIELILKDGEWYFIGYFRLIPL